MGRLDGITLEELHEIREQTEGGKPRERVLAAIGRKQGDHLDTLAERHGVVEKTLRNWLDRFVDFLADHEDAVKTFKELDSGHLREYARHLTRQGWTAGTMRTY